MIIGVILARAGSKRLPGKNHKLFDGRPMVAWSILAGQGSTYIDELVVSTDDREVAAIALDYNVRLVTRPPPLATDDADSYGALKHAVSKFDVVNTVVLLQPTSPLRSSADIDKCVENHLDTGMPAATFADGEGVPNGAVYAGSYPWLLGGGNWDTDTTIEVGMPVSRSVDIDTQEDFDRALRIRHGTGSFL